MAKRVADEVFAVGRQVGASPKELLAAAMTGIVESGFRNLPGGDADSQGWRQERASLYSNPTNVQASARRFFQEAKQFNRPGISAGELAARVQRPAAQYRGRYSQVRGQARSLLGQAGGGGGGGSTDSGGTTQQGGTTSAPDFGSQQSALPLIQALTQSQAAGPPSVSVQAPSFSAQAVLPEGFGTVSGGGGPAPGPDIGSLAAAIKTLGGDVPQATAGSQDTPATDSPTRDVSGNYPGLKGGVKFNPNADRPGVKTQAITKEFLSRVAGFSHRTISVGTGTNHNQMTTSGNVSDHWTGHAADLPMPVDSKIGDLTAAHALEAAGVPWSQAYRMAQKGGVFNVTPKKGQFKGHRVQVLWKTMVGGNHHNHVHVGIR
jgi:hypothetical protein